MTYRDEMGALRARMAILECKLHNLRIETEKQEAKRLLPSLDKVESASPCSESWDMMSGDDRVRFCGKCHKNVYNVAAMTRDEAEQLIQGHEELPCLRLRKRRDGTVITSDCPVGVRRKRVTRIAAAALALGGAGAALTLMSEPVVEMGGAFIETQGEVVDPRGSATIPGNPPPPGCHELDDGTIKCRKAPPGGAHDPNDRVPVLGGE